jgi:hypothetical protein
MKTPVRLLVAFLGILAFINTHAQEIHIKARFLEVPKGTLDGFGRKIIGITNSPDQFVGILTGENLKTVMRALESRAGAEELAEPEVTTLSGRQVEMRATQIITIITNFAYRETMTNSFIFPQTNAVETGPILDTVASVLPDGYGIDLDATASLTEFLGYDNPTHTTATNNSAGEKIDLPGILPRLRVRQASASIKLWDGQTVVLGPLNARFFDDGKELTSPWNHFVKIKRAGDRPSEANGNVLAEKADKEVLVFITVTLVDPAGNRIHSDEDAPFAKNSIPPQDGP